MEAIDSFCFPKNTKNPNPSPIGKKFGFCCCGAPPGTRTLGPLIKRNRCATIINFQNYANSSFLAFCRKLTFCICCILCSCHLLLHPLSSYSGVQKCAESKPAPWNRYRIFMQSRENGLVWLENGIRNFTCLNQASNVHQQPWFMAGIWTTAISYKSEAAFSMWTFLGGNT